jgi:hypothetical protein
MCFCMTVSVFFFFSYERVMTCANKHDAQARSCAEKSEGEGRVSRAPERKRKLPQGAFWCFHAGWLDMSIAFCDRASLALVHSIPRFTELNFLAGAPAAPALRSIDSLVVG